jgi:hypothetical protein
VAYEKFSVHIPHRPARKLFQACRIFDPAYLLTNNISKKDIRHYSAIKEFENVSNLQFQETELDLFWSNLHSQLPFLSNIALNYIWLPVSSCSVERSFSLYNSILDENRQNLSKESLKTLSMLYFNGI